MAGRRLVPVTPGKSTMTMSPACSTLLLLTEALRGISQRMSRQIPHVLLAPFLAVVHDAPGGNVIQDHRCQLQPLRWREWLDDLVVYFFGGCLCRHRFTRRPCPEFTRWDLL